MLIVLVIETFGPVCVQLLYGSCVALVLLIDLVNGILPQVVELWT